tara:strand:+ start:142 stop:2085 length:1944 start_codon:yes stop_codon:yes gene_type:complete
MSFLLKDVAHRSLADSVLNELLTKRSTFYFYIGKILPWPDPQNPPDVENSSFYESDVRNRIVSIKRIESSDASLVVTRKDWTTGRTYDQFEDYYTGNPAPNGATSLRNADFYVMTSEFKVYKCIFNNNNGTSTVEPNSSDLAPVKYADDYIWKYMYTIPLSLRSRFLTSEFMPVTKSVQNSFYSDGQIDKVTITSKGSGYTGNAKVALSFNAPGNITFGFRGSPGADGNVTPNIAPSISTSGRFEKIIITNTGNNIRAANIAIFDIDNDGSNLFANVKVGNTLHIGNGNAILLPVLQEGKMEDVLIADPGKNYTSNIQTTIVINGDGGNALLTPFVNDVGEVEDIIVNDRGEGFTFVDLNIVSDTGSGAIANVDVSTGDLDTLQSTVELSAISGGLHNFKINNGGSNYSNLANLTLTVSGDGSGFTGNVVLDSTSNTISSITVTNPGVGFTFANVTITGGGGTDANISPIISPPNGHGFDAPTELFAETVILFSTINNENIQGVDVNNDFRQFGIIKDIEQSGSKKAFANSLGTPTFLVTMDTVTDSDGDPVDNDTILEIISTDFRFEVVQTLSTTKQMLLTSLNNHTLAIGDKLRNSSTATDFTVQTVNAVPDINKFSGDLLFIDNRTSVSFTDEQLVTLRTILKL